MKIPLKFSEDQYSSAIEQENRQLEQLILAVKSDDWEAKGALVKIFMPLIRKQAQKRTADPVKLDEYCEEAKKAVIKAAKRYKKSKGPAKFRLEVVDYIEKAMDNIDRGGNFLVRWLSRFLNR